MSLPLATQRMTRPLLLIAAADVALAFSIWGGKRGAAAAIGAALSVANWFALRWLASRLVGNGAGKAVLSLLLVAKIGLLMAVVFVLINRLALDAVGLAFGLGVLFVGPVLAALSASGSASGALSEVTHSEVTVAKGAIADGNGAPRAPVHSSAVRSAREER
jgi:hypothetical protein